MEEFKIFLENSSGDYITILLFIGSLICIILHLLESFGDYLIEKAWLKNDYEEIIYYLSKHDHSELAKYFHTNPKKRMIYYGALSEYDNHLKKRNNLNKFINKFKKTTKK